MKVSTSTRVTSGVLGVFAILTIIGVAWRDVPWVNTMTNIIVPVMMVGVSAGLGWFIYEMLRIAVTGEL
jgi:hypothetical protein